MNANNNTAVTAPVNVAITYAPPPSGKVATVIAEKAAVAEVSRAINAAYYAGLFA